VLSVINTMLACCDSLDVIAAYLNGRPDHQRATQTLDEAERRRCSCPQRICAMLTDMSYFSDQPSSVERQVSRRR
jgi:hypothetical protein